MPKVFTKDNGFQTIAGGCAGTIYIDKLNTGAYVHFSFGNDLNI